MVKCPHNKLCGQKVRRGSLALCKGLRRGFDFDKCFSEHSLDAQGIIPEKNVKRSEEWASECA